MHNKTAFTIFELLVVIVILVLLLTMLLPSFMNITKKTEIIICKSNMRQLVVGYFQHAADNRGRLMGGMPANNSDAYVRRGAGYGPIKNGALYPYVNDVTLYQCPSDPNGLERSYVIVGPLKGERWNDKNSTWYQGGTDKLGGVFSANSQIVFIEESDRRGWNIGSFLIYCIDSQYYHWIDYVGLFHEDKSADNYAFLDGHVETRRWETQAVIDMATQKRNFVWTRNNEDWDWLRPRYRNMPTDDSGRHLISYYPPFK